jgi:hypothetical protein
MPTFGLSLAGFMDQAAAIEHLRDFCIPQDPSDAALVAIWTAATARLGAPVANAGNPAIAPIPPTHAPHLAALSQAPWFAAAAAQPQWAGATFQLVEIDPLLAFQVVVDTERSAHHCKALSYPPALDELMPLCLPLAMPNEEFRIYRGERSLLVKARCLNVQAIHEGWFPQGNGAGVVIGSTLPPVHVVRFNGRCFLHNGFHRVVGAKMAGATQVPCIVRDVPDEQAVGIHKGTFSLAQLTSANPPTLAHFTDQRAWSVRIRAHSRVVSVHWSQYVVYDE